MTLVADASAVVAAISDVGPTGVWADRLLGSERLTAPHFMPAEVASVLRREALRGRLPIGAATGAHARLLALKIELHPYAPFAERVWQLRDTVTPYDAWYVALAEALEVPLATLDVRLAQAPGPRCEFVTPPS